MKLVDANLLLHAINNQSRQRQVAQTWLDEKLAGNEPIGFSWIVLLAFARIATRPGVFPRPLTLDETLSLVDAWLAQPAALIVEPTSRHLSVLKGLLRAVGTAGNLVSDAHLAALAIEHDADIVSFDGDFARFTGVRWQSP